MSGPNTLHFHETSSQKSTDGDTKAKRYSYLLLSTLFVEVRTKSFLQKLCCLLSESMNYPKLMLKAPEKPFTKFDW